MNPPPRRAPDRFVPMARAGQTRTFVQGPRDEPGGWNARTAGITAHEVHTTTTSSFRHEALLYADADEFVRGTAPFIRDGLEAGEPILVAVSEAKIGLLREELGSDAGDVQFADMARLGT